MPAPVPVWQTNTFPSAKSLNLALYTCDGTADNPNGIAFQTYRPILFESYNTAATVTSSSGGVQSTLSSTGTAPTATGIIAYDSAGYYGQASDMPGKGFYQFSPVINGSSGDGLNPGGWTLLSHFTPIVHTATQISVSADITGIGGALNIPGTRQPASSATDSCPFFLDLLQTNVGVTWQPAVTVRDSAAASTTVFVNSSDSSGKTSRFYSIWGTVSATSSGSAVFTVGNQYTWVAPPGVFVVEVQATGAGAGGGAGNVTGAGADLGGGGGGGGEYQASPLNVTPGNSYTLTVGQGGAGGITGSGTGNGSNGQASTFPGDNASLSAAGGTAGLGATTLAVGAGGAGGTSAAFDIEFRGGSGHAGFTNSKNAVLGGGGGSSGGNAKIGNNATGNTGAPAPVGGGPGGTGGGLGIGVVQGVENTVNGTNILQVNFKSPVQAGNSVIACVTYNGTSPGGEPTATLSDIITPMVADANVDVSNIGVPMQVGVYHAFNVSGGQTGIIVTGHGTVNANKVVLCQMWEVTGLGPTPGVDQTATNSHATNENQYRVTSNTTTAAPEFWVGTVGAQQVSNFTINQPFPDENWITFGQDSNHSANNIYSRILSGYQIAPTTGVMKFSGGMTQNASWACAAVSYTSSLPGTGNPPPIGPGGGGGGGLGPNGNGANGFDGQMLLSWQGLPGSGYGNPTEPAPYAFWDGSTSIGVVDGLINVNFNSNIVNTLNFLSDAPAFRISSIAGGTIGNNTLTAVSFSATTPTLDNYSGWSGSANTYTVQQAGLYLFHGLACFSANSGGTRQPAVTINGTSYWGPPTLATSSGTTHVAKTQIFSLQAGDTVQFACRQTSGGAVTLSTSNPTRYLLLWLGQAGLPAASWNPPDPTFRWASGTPGAQLPGLFNTHMGNDLSFLVNRPYIMAYQATAQTSIASGNFVTITLDTVQGYIHNTDVGDNYVGWTSGASNSYTAQVPGWYLITGEVFSGTGPSTGTATLTAGVLPTTSGGYSPSQTPDAYQQQVITSNSNIGGGATIFGLQYMLTGESIQPQIRASAQIGSTYNTFVLTANGATYNSHFEAIWISS